MWSERTGGWLERSGVTTRQAPVRRSTEQIRQIAALASE
jgi:hypothetical protein